MKPLFASGTWTARGFGPYWLATLRIRLERDDEIIYLYGVQIGDLSLWWTNPFKGER